MEMHVLGRYAMDAPFSGGQGREDLQRPLPGALREALGAFDDAAQVGPGTLLLVVGVHEDPGRRQAGPLGLRSVQLPAADGEPSQARQHFGDVGAGVEQAAKGHVPGDTREAVPPKRSLRNRPRRCSPKGCCSRWPRARLAQEVAPSAGPNCRPDDCGPVAAVAAGRGAAGTSTSSPAAALPARPRMRATAHAAPKPLSMPTTEMPGAQLASMAKSAVTPWREEP